MNKKLCIVSLVLVFFSAAHIFSFAIPSAITPKIKIPGAFGFVGDSTGFGITYDFEELAKLPITVGLTFGGRMGNYGNVAGLFGQYKIMDRVIAAIGPEKQHVFRWFWGAGIQLTFGSLASQSGVNERNAFNAQYDAAAAIGGTHLQWFRNTYGTKYKEPDMFTAGVFPYIGASYTWQNLKMGKIASNIQVYVAYKPTIGWLGGGIREEKLEYWQIVDFLGFTGGVKVWFD